MNEDRPEIDMKEYLEKRVKEGNPLVIIDPKSAVEHGLRISYLSPESEPIDLGELHRGAGDFIRSHRKKDSNVIKVTQNPEDYLDNE